MPRRILEGQVVSAKTEKTITVLVERRFMHPIYKKYVKKSKRYAAHDAANACQEGQRVRIIECAPISKTKRWTVLAEEGGAS
jgi:small subunit ribosomal protein S17